MPPPSLAIQIIVGFEYICSHPSPQPPCKYKIRQQVSLLPTEYYISRLSSQKPLVPILPHRLIRLPNALLCYANPTSNPPCHHRPIVFTLPSYVLCVMQAITNPFPIVPPPFPPLMHLPLDCPCTNDPGVCGNTIFLFLVLLRRPSLIILAIIPLSSP